MKLIMKQMMREDIPSLTPIMKAAFDRDSQIHLNKTEGGPPGYDDGTFLNKWGMSKYASPFCVYLDEKLIGAVILFIHSNQQNVLGCIFIDPRYEEKGLGTKLWQLIESMYPETVLWQTETPIFSHRNHHFYINKLGFHVVAIENPKDYNEGQFKLVKQMK